MKTTVYLNEFRDAFQKIRPDNFSYEGLGALFEYLEECERDTGENYELDVIALCCDFSEDTPEAIAESYSIEISDCGGDYYEISAKVKEYLEDENYLIGEVSGGFVYRQHWKGHKMQSKYSLVIERTFQGAWRISAIVGDYLVTEQFFGYTKREAVARFQEMHKE